MTLVLFLTILTVGGVLVGWMNFYLPIAPTMKSILNWTVLVAVVLWLIDLSGVMRSFPGIRVGG